MARHRQLLHGLVFSMLLALPAAAEPGVRWTQDIETAKATARQTGRLVLIHFWTPECVPCRTLEMNVFNQPGVAAAVESQFVPVQLNANENPATAQGLGITQVPTDVILTPEGQVIGMLVSPTTPTEYVAEVSQVARQYAGRPGGAYQSAVAAAPLPPQFNAAYANLQFATPPQAAAGNQGMAAAGMPAGPQTNASQPGSYAAPYQAPPPAAQMVANRAYGAQTWPATSAAPSTAPAAPMAVQNPYAQASPTMRSPTANNPYAAPASPSAPGAAGQQAASTVPAAPPDLRRLPPGAPPLGFDGYCPVTMRNLWKWVPGDPKWGAIHRGRTYWFVNQREQQQFLTNPDYYSPALSGMDPVFALDHRQAVPGKRDHALDYDNQFYLFSSEATLQQFTSDPERYAQQAREAVGIQPGRVVR